MNTRISGDSWQFVHICDLQPGTPRSFRFTGKHRENWQTALGQLRAEKDIAFATVGGDLTRDGFYHRYELDLAKSELDTLPYPWHAIPGNMDVGNKAAPCPGATGRPDPDLGCTDASLTRFASAIGDFPWSFAHHNVRISGCYEAVAGSGLPQEARLWQWLEHELPALPRHPLHVMVLHYPLFIDAPGEKNWDLKVKEEYFCWYFSLNAPHRQRIIGALKRAGVTHVLSGHIHCRRPPQVFDGIFYLKCAGIAFGQWPDKWPDGDMTLGYYRMRVEGDTLHPEFVALERESDSTDMFGKGGHVSERDRDYALAREPGIY